NPQRGEIRSTHDFIGTVLTIGSIDYRMARQLELHRSAVAGHWRRATESHTMHAGDTLHGFCELCEIGVVCHRFGKLTGIRKTERKIARGIHSRVHVDQPKEAADQQPGTSQKHEGYSDFSHHQTVTDDLASDARRRSTSALFHHSAEIGPRCL